MPLRNDLTRIKNYFFPTDGSASVYKKPAKSDATQKNLSHFISPVQFQRIRHDIRLWRDAIIEAEMPWFPQRVKMQRMYQDTILNLHVLPCMERRIDLTLLRDFKICDDKGVESEELKTIFRNYVKTPAGIEVNTAAWFDDFITYALDAIFFGYSLISLGDVVNDSYPELSIIRRQNVSPDRKNVSAYVYSLSGIDFTAEPYVDWHIYVPTISRLGVSPCGYGLLYPLAFAEIMLRNNIGANADFIELFGQPIRKGTTTKTEEAERAAFAQDLQNMGASAWILLDEGIDTLEIIESRSAGTGHQSYDNFESRLEKKVSKIILGHADALDSTPGKLGGGQGADESPAGQALIDKQTKDGIFVQNIVNSQLIPRMRLHGFPIPLNYHFELKNDDEKETFRRRQDNSNKVTADIAKTMKDAGMQMDAQYFEERTGIKTTIPEPPPIVNPLIPTPAQKNGKHKEEVANV